MTPGRLVGRVALWSVELNLESPVVADNELHVDSPVARTRPPVANINDRHTLDGKLCQYGIAHGDVAFGTGHDGEPQDVVYEVRGIGDRQVWIDGEKVMELAFQRLELFDAIVETNDDPTGFNSQGLESVGPGDFVEFGRCDQTPGCDVQFVVHQ